MFLKTYPNQKSVNKKTSESRKVLQKPVHDVYKEFRPEHPEIETSRTKFHKLRPRNVLSANKNIINAGAYYENIKENITC